MSEWALHAGEGAGKRESPTTGPCGGGVGQRCGEVRGSEQLRRIPQPEWGILFLFFRGWSRREAGLGAAFDGTDARG
jgi:hypothetical protein